MGVYLPNMEMLTKGYHLILVHADGTVQTTSGETTAVFVPPHGRLIDADAMLMRINHEVMEAYMDGVCYGVHPNQEYLYLLGEIIDDAPTIILAEGGA